MITRTDPVIAIWSDSKVDKMITRTDPVIARRPVVSKIISKDKKSEKANDTKSFAFFVTFVTSPFH